MKNETLYNRTLDILVDAYFNDTLEHGNYCGCAVGNIIAANLKIPMFKIDNSKGGSEVTWHNPNIPPDRTNASTWYSIIDSEQKEYSLEGIQLLEATGYHIGDIMKIESSFENAKSECGTKDEIMFKGLMNVIETLDQIHENTDTELTSNSKKRFNKQTQKINPCTLTH